MTKELFSSLQQTPAIGKATLFDFLQANKLEKQPLILFFMMVLSYCCVFLPVRSKNREVLGKKNHTTSSSHDRREQQLSLSNAEWYVTNK